MKYLFDENCSVSDKFLEEHPGCENVKYKLHEGVKDETILQKFNKNEYVIVTQDVDLALDALIIGFKVIYYHVEKKQYNFIFANELEKSIIDEFNKFRPYIKLEK